MMNLKKILSIFIDEEVRIQIGEKIINGADYRDIKDYLEYEVASVSPSVYNNYLLITLNKMVNEDNTVKSIEHDKAKEILAKLMEIYKDNPIVLERHLQDIFKNEWGVEVDGSEN